MAEFLPYSFCGDLLAVMAANPLAELLSAAVEFLHRECGCVKVKLCLEFLQNCTVLYM